MRISKCFLLLIIHTAPCVYRTRYTSVQWPRDGQCPFNPLQKGLLIFGSVHLESHIVSRRRPMQTTKPTLANIMHADEPRRTLWKRLEFCRFLFDLTLKPRNRHNYPTPKPWIIEPCMFCTQHKQAHALKSSHVINQLYYSAPQANTTWMVATILSCMANAMLRIS